MIIETNQLAFGDIVQDVFTGFIGTVTGVSKFATGCSQLLVQPKSEQPEDSGKPTKFEEPRWFDCDRLMKIGVNPEVFKIASKHDTPLETVQPALPKGGERNDDRPRR